MIKGLDSWTSDSRTVWYSMVNGCGLYLKWRGLDTGDGVRLLFSCVLPTR